MVPDGATAGAAAAGAARRLQQHISEQQSIAERSLSALRQLQKTEPEPEPEPAAAAEAPPAHASAAVWCVVILFLLLALVASAAYGVKRKERLGLRDTLSRDMVVSSWVVSARTLLLVRSAILVFCTISLLVMIDPVHNGVGAIGGAFFWFTNWGFILLTVYFGQAVAYTLRGPPPESSAAQPQTAWQTAIWLNFEIAGMSAIFIDVVLWGILWPSSGFDAMFFHPMMLIVHGANFFIVALEMALNRIPVHKDHYFAVVGYTAIYGLFATFEHLVLYDGRRWPYFFMDVEHLGWSVMLWYCVLLLIQAAFWYLLVRIDGIKARFDGRQPSGDDAVASDGEGVTTEGQGGEKGEVYVPPLMEAPP